MLILSELLWTSVILNFNFLIIIIIIISNHWIRAEYGLKNFEDWGGSYLPRPKANSLAIKINVNTLQSASVDVMFDSRLYLPVSQQVLGMFRIADILLPSSCIQIAVLVMLLGSSYLVWPKLLEAQNPERVFPILGPCQGVFTDQFIFRHILGHFFPRKENLYHDYVRIRSIRYQKGKLNVIKRQEI